MNVFLFRCGLVINTMPMKSIAYIKNTSILSIDYNNYYCFHFVFVQLILKFKIINFEMKITIITVADYVCQLCYQKNETNIVKCRLLTCKIIQQLKTISIWIQFISLRVCSVYSEMRAIQMKQMNLFNNNAVIG